MTQSRSVCNRIRNARASLDNAERSFRSNQEVRGELDLMLAEAELDNLRQKRQGISWTRHMLAACFAVLVLASGCLGWWWASAYGVNTTNAAGLQGMSANADSKVLNADKEKKITVSRQDNIPSSVAPEKKAVVKEKPDIPAQATAPILQQDRKRSGSVHLSASQMRQLIRSGKQELENVR
jgi:hypothetical protein